MSESNHHPADLDPASSDDAEVVSAPVIVERGLTGQQESGQQESGQQDPGQAVSAQHGSGDENAVTSPAKVMRIGSMVRQLLEEVRQAPLDEASRERLAEVYERSVTELADALSEDLQEELRNLALPFSDDTPSEAELRVAKAQLVGWLEGLFHGIQATLFAQQLAARQQFEQMRQLPGGATPGAHGPGGTDQSGGAPGGVYL